MAFEITGHERSFEITDGKKTTKLSDPNPSMSPEEVAKFYSTKHPELTNAIIEGPKIVAGKAVYTMTTKAGKLG